MFAVASREDRALGAACLIVSPAISGLFLGLVATACTYPTRGSNAFGFGSLVGAIAFAANLVAIYVVASGSARWSRTGVSSLNTERNSPSAS